MDITHDFPEVFHSIEKLLDFSYATIEDIDDKKLAFQLLHLLEMELHEIHPFLHEMTNLISDKKQRNQLLDSVKVILKCLRALKHYAETGIQSDKMKFLNTANDLEVRLLTIYTDLLNKRRNQETRENILNLCESHFQVLIF